MTRSALLERFLIASFSFTAVDILFNLSWSLQQMYTFVQIYLSSQLGGGGGGIMMESWNKNVLIYINRWQKQMQVLMPLMNKRLNCLGNSSEGKSGKYADTTSTTFS